MAEQVIIPQKMKIIGAFSGYVKIFTTSIVSLHNSIHGVTFASVKQMLAIGFLLLFGFSTTGATLQLHFCCGKLKDINLKMQPSAPDCGMEDMAENVPCCETVHFTSDLDDHFAFKDAPLKLDQPLTADVSPVTFPPVTALIHLSGQKVHHANAPPLAPSTALYKLHQVFRI